MPSAAKQRVAYIIQSALWEYDDEFHYLADPEDQAVRAYTDRARAEAFRLERELAERRNWDSPFQFGQTFAELTTRSEKELAAWMKAHGFTPPVAKGKQEWQRCSAWSQWFEELDDAEKEQAWDAFDKIFFFRVVKVELGEEE